MAYQPIEELLPKSGYSVYKLIRIAAKRSLELADGSPKLIDGVPLDAKTPTIALDEIRAGKVVLKDGDKQYGLPVKGKKKEAVTADAAAEAKA